MSAKTTPPKQLTAFAAANAEQILRQTAVLSATAKTFHVHGRLKKATYEKIVGKIEAAEKAIRDAMALWAND